VLAVADEFPISAETNFEVLLLKLELRESVALHQINNLLYVFDVHDVKWGLVAKTDVFGNKRSFSG
jgi:hypothetical protein